MKARQLTFKRIQDTTADDWAVIATRDNSKLFEELPDRLLSALRFLENGDFYTVNGLEHSLQAGTRALRDERHVEYVVAALLHDVGDLVGPRNHAAVAAAILRPYVSERIAWIVEHHTVSSRSSSRSEATDSSHPKKTATRSTSTKTACSIPGSIGCTSERRCVSPRKTETRGPRRAPST